VADRKSFLLRVDPAVLEALQRWANDDLRSLNAQIEFVLRDALKRVGRGPRRDQGPAGRGGSEEPNGRGGGGGQSGGGPPNDEGAAG
jgi:hypothetical protein